jgi:flagellar biosynthetic protein FliQ
MTDETLIYITRETLWVIIKTSLPLLLLSLIVGLVISIFQTVTSIKEQTLTFVPKILVIFLGIMLLGNWMLSNIVVFMQQLWGSFGAYTR